MANIKNFGIVGLGSNVQFGKGGAKLVQTEGTFAAKSADNSAFVRFAIANAVASDDAVTLQQMNAAVAAVSGDATVLQAELDATQVGAGLAADGSYVAVAEGILAGATSLADADAKLAAALAAETIARTEADDLTANAITGLGDRLTTAEGDIVALEGNSVAQQTTIDALIAADVVLDGRLDALETSVADDARIVALEGNAAAQQTAIDAAAAAAALLEGRVAAAEGDIGALEGNSVAQQTAIDAADGRLTAAELAHAALLANAIVKDGSVAMTGDLDLGNNAIANVATPINATDAANKSYVDSKVSNLGNAFNYVGALVGGAEEASAFDLATLPEGGKDVGDYYKVTTLGWFTLDGVAKFFNSNDGLVFNEAGSFDKIDNTDATVEGTAGQIVVDGNVDTGYFVSIDGAYTAARQAEVTAEATARADADTILTTAIADAAADLAQEVLDRAAADLVLTNAVADVAGDLAALELSTTANAVAQQAAIEALQTGAADDSRFVALEANAVAQQTAIDALEATDVAHQAAIDALVVADTALDGRLDIAETDIGALKANAVAQQAEIDALEVSLTNLSQDTIKSTNEKYSVHAADTDVTVANVDGAASLKVTLDNAEARIAVVSTEADADLRLVAQGAGQVIIGEEGVGVIQSDDGYDMTVAGGAGGGKLLLKGAEVSIQDEAGTEVAKFVSGGSSALTLETTNNAVQFVATGAAADVDLVFAAKGAGNVDVSGAKVVNVADGVAATDAINKGQLDAALDAVAAAEVGHVVSVAASVAAANGQVALGAVTGVVTRVRVVILTPYNAGATLTVGTAALSSDLVAAADLDEAAAGVYLIETARDYAAADLVVEIAGATQGSAKVYVEYIKA